MNRDELIEGHMKFCEKMHSIIQKKNADYSGHSDDPFKNLTTVETLDVTSTEVGILTRMTDKFSRINGFIKKGILAVEDESIIDTLVDMANYSALLALYITAKKRKHETKATGGSHQKFD